MNLSRKIKRAFAFGNNDNGTKKKSTLSKFNIFERGAKWVVSIFCGIVVLAFWISSGLSNDTDQILQYLAVIGSFLWLIIYTIFGGLNKTMEVIDASISKKNVWDVTEFWEKIAFELMPLIIPFVLIVYKYRFTQNFLDDVDKQAAKLPVEEQTAFREAAIRENLQLQLGREDVIIQTIPLVLFGIGLIFENQEFYHNKFLLGGVFFGTGIPMMISGLMIETDVNKLLIMEMMQYIFITFGITMIVQALFKYYLFKRDLKKPEKEKNDMNSKVFIEALKKNCSEENTKQLGL